MSEIAHDTYEEEEIKETQLTLAQLQKMMPTGRKQLATQDFVDKFNDVLLNTDIRRELRDNFLGYLNVLQDPRYRITEYLNAVKFVSYKLMGDSSIVAYTKTFPERYQKMLDKGWAAKDIASRVSIFNRSQIVNKVMEQTLIPSYVLNQDLYQQALNVQADLMMNAKSEKVRTDAANSILAQLKMPEASKVQVDVNVKQDDSINELRQTTLALVKQQRQLIEAGAMTTKEVAHSSIIIDGEIEDVEVNR